MPFYLDHAAVIIALWISLSIGILSAYYLAVKLKQNRELFKLALKSSGDGIWDWDISANTVHLLSQQKDIFGFGEGSIKVKMSDWKRHIHPDDISNVELSIKQYLDGNTEKFIHEHRLIFKDKNVKWVLSRGMVARQDRHGKPLRIVGTYTDITERKALENRLENLAYFDSLTSLPNRTLFNDRLKLALAYAKREKKKLAVMFIDLDMFKQINDLHGHKIGDKVLKKTAQRLTACVRESDTVGRVGGDEFIVLLPMIDNELDALVVASKIVDSLARPIEIIRAGESSPSAKAIPEYLQVSASIGISIYPKDGEDEKLLIINADLAMYQAKRNGKNQARFFDAQTPAETGQPLVKPCPTVMG